MRSMPSIPKSLVIWGRAPNTKRATRKTSFCCNSAPLLCSSAFPFRNRGLRVSFIPSWERSIRDRMPSQAKEEMQGIASVHHGWTSAKQNPGRLKEKQRDCQQIVSFEFNAIGTRAQNADCHDTVLVLANEAIAAAIATSDIGTCRRRFRTSNFLRNVVI